MKDTLNGGTRFMKSEMLIPAIAAMGFGIQQFLQVVADPVASLVITFLKNQFGTTQADGSRLLPGGISDVDAKKVLLGITSLILGLLIAFPAKEVRVLQVAGLDLPGWDLFITALTISAGTEGVNSVMKLLQYVKDAVKTKAPPSVAQNSPVPQAPAAPLPPVTLMPDANTLAALDVDSAEHLLDVQSRVKEEDYDA
jgi:hypothetical protein